jgi:hypothetical protein
MGNWLLDGRSLDLGVAVEVEVDCLAPFLVGMFVSLLWGTLFVKVSKDRCLLVVMYGFGLYVVCTCMAGSTVKDIYGSGIGILGEG